MMMNKRLRGGLLIVCSLLLIVACLLYLYTIAGKSLFAQVSHHGGATANPLQLLRTYWYTLAIIPLLALAWVASRGSHRYAPGISHGSARFATLREIKVMWHPTRSQESRLLLGTMQGRVISLPEEQIENHVLLLAPTGAGKTSNIILPNILQERSQRSVFIIDPKQELVEKSAGAMQQRFSRVLIFAPTDPARSIQYNPLAHIQNMDDARDFALCWIQNTGQSKEPFWDRNAELLITAMVLHLLETESTPSLYRLAEIFSGKSFDEIKKLLNGSQSQDAKDLAHALLTNLEKNDKLAGSVMTDLANRFFMLRSPIVRQVTNTSDINFDQMDEEAIAFYMAVPFADAERLKPLSACLMMQMFRSWVRRADAHASKRLARGITCYLDEFANAGKVPHYEAYISTLRSKGVGLIMAIQNLSQLDVLYEKTGRETIVSNAKTQLLLPGAGQQECEYFSRRMGDTTVLTESQSLSERSEINLFIQREGWAQNRVARPLMTADEIRRMEPGSILMIADRLAPLLLKAQPYYRNAELVKRVHLPFENVDSAQSKGQIENDADQDASHVGMHAAPTEPLDAKAPVELQEQRLDESAAETNAYAPE